MPVDAIEDAPIRCEVERNEWKYGRKRGRVKLRVHVDLVGRDRKDAAESLLLLEERRADVDKPRLQNRAYLGFYLVYLFARVPVDSKVEPDFKYPLLCLLQRIAQALKIGVCGVEHWVAHHALLFARRDLALHLSDFLLEFPQHFVGIHRVNENGNVDDLVHVDDRREPASRQESWV